MIIDFSRLGSENTSDTVLSPREIFNALPNKNEDKFQYPRDVQSQVWNRWYESKDNSDLIIKMNTGSGKTVVGLLILKSCLNEGKSPAVYIAPDNYLIQQITDEAKDLGIEVTTDAHSQRFSSGKAILIANIFKLVNGLSVFGVGDDGEKISIGSLLIDDAHACLDTIEDQFTLNIPRSSEVYASIYDIFKDGLRRQCESKAIEIEAEDPNAYLQVPFWDWQSKTGDVSKAIIAHKEDDAIKYTWPLIKESFKLCRCVVGSRNIEISPFFIPIQMIPSISNASRRIFMTATLADDSILASHFDVAGHVPQAIVPDSAGDIGDRMILVPQMINTEINNDDIKMICKFVSKRLNVVVIVPSVNRARYWGDVSDVVLDKNNIPDGIAKLKSSHVGLVIMVNRYDGIDLPKKACRLLVIDGLPDVRRMIDKINQGVLLGGEKTSSQIIQKIEQGMGRGVRSNDDHCVVLLMGKDLASKLYSTNAFQKFSPGTKAQLTLSERLSEQIKGKGSKELLDVMKLCLTRDEKWIRASKGAMATLKYEDSPGIDPYALTQRQAYDAALCGKYQEAAELINTLVNQTSGNKLKGYLKQCMAEYVNFFDQLEAQKILMSGSSYNNRILKPLAGISYHKLTSTDIDQAQNAVDFFKGNYKDPNAIVIDIDGILELLIFKPDTANAFEAAIKRIAMFLGFTSQRPESEFGKGPDILWSLGGLKYFIIECKNGAITDKINKHDCNQLNGSVVWFNSNYDKTCRSVPIMIHKSKSPEYAASLNPDTRIIGEKELQEFKDSIRQFIATICSQRTLNDLLEVRKALQHHNLLGDQLFKNLGKSFKP
ncbi:MAG: DEAD/DEAH box helicase family protein [Desulfovibrio sp.]|nr:DEAD/DEAH box helicase family protein [Desulfovibrio sp.]